MPTSTDSPAEILKTRDLKGAELMAVYDALSAAIGGLHGIMNQPRCADGADYQSGYNAAGEMISDFAEWIAVQQDELVQSARDRIPADEREADILAWVEIRHQANMMDDPLDLAALATRHAQALRSFPKRAA